ncbi:MAG: HIT family protein [Ignavibacteriaceae bacterium]|jgi:histidine triad (HIT) family protein|nr:HIT family protein [Ignavibacteriaceae bacterium]MCU0406238.1 HIT family protein [Ignavibacteriaceae bacterium]
MECIFCNIKDRKSEAEIIFEDEHVLAFLDIQPVNYGHTLVIPKNHFDNFLTVPKDELDKLIHATQFIAGVVKRSLNADGFNVISNNGNPAGQSVYHFHFHIIPRFDKDFTLKPVVRNYSQGALQEYGEQIRSFISKYKDIYNG